MRTEDHTFDVIIVGGGMVGLTLAAALGHTSLRVAVVERSEPDPAAGTGDWDQRVSAITVASRRILDNVGAWQGIATRRVSPFREMDVRDASGPGHIHFDAADLGEPLLGHIVENGVIRTALHDVVAELPNVRLYEPATIRRMGWDSDHMYLRLEDDRLLAGGLLVGADGGRSWVREQAGITTRGWDYGQQAVVATVRTAEPHQETAWQRFLPDGPLAFLPLADGRCSIVWSTTPEQAEALTAMEPETFCGELGEAFDHILGPVEETGPRASFPLRLLHANAYVRPRLALVGDAAHTIHPLAGQGVNLGLADAATLAETLLEAVEQRRGIGSIPVLRRYERRRKADNVAMMGAMDGFKRLFGSELAPLRWMRNIGLNLTHTVLPVKNGLMRHAMGLTGDLPELARRDPERR
ncbi:2-octaprenylphenol hydroxylase [Thiohalospira halophila DSM 15071]|uniref:2-octaprenylphenol hydroxylase n=1 Tax=Thiohalospira halophila DSM 15071 TaxID=1123397 RepID=A0A1I1SA00_9GAMM|nr:UbiH/UbiF/VisC/COQ6 family ubiquinone biosynthesis hydroxylase [Thiohalospira halophila]SFD43152.1 2-octaprenylphenol hydroxylase [Thiohalospira halophila DSM 15071]